MAIILDADVVIRGEKGTFDLGAWVAARAEEHFEIAAITVAELWHGVARASGAHKTRRQRYLQTIVNALPVIPYTELTAYEHARLWAELESAGKMIGFRDLIVAATALERGSDVATFNTKHFAQIRDLTVIEPTRRRTGTGTCGISFCNAAPPASGRRHESPFPDRPR